MPHSSIDTQAGWTKSGWHRWAYGWKLHLATTVGGVWIPLSAYLTPTNVSDNRVVLSLVEQLPEEARFVLGDTHYDAPEVRVGCLASGKGPYPHTDPGVEVRRIFHRLRNTSIETSERALQGRLRVPHSGTHQGPKRHRALRAWGGLRLPVGVA